MREERREIFDIKLNTKDIWLFSMYNANRGLLGVFNLFFSLASLYYLLRFFDRLETGRRLILLLFVLLFTVIQPAMLYLKSARQARSENIRAGMRLVLDEKGFEVMQAEKSQVYTWDTVFKMRLLPAMLIIYTDSIRAYLIPKRYWEADRESLRAFLREKAGGGRLR